MIETQREQLNELAIKIAELKEENERLNGELSICESLLKIHVSRTDKAIEYIETFKEKRDLMQTQIFNYGFLLDILEGVESNE